VKSGGATLDFLLTEPSRMRPPLAAFRPKLLGRQDHPAPRAIHTDGHGAYPPVIAQLKTEGVLHENCRHHGGRYLNNIVEQNDRAIKLRVKASQHF